MLQNKKGKKLNDKEKDGHLVYYLFDCHHMIYKENITQKLDKHAMYNESRPLS